MQPGEEANSHEKPTGEHAQPARMAMYWLMRRMNRAGWTAEAEEDFRRWLTAQPLHAEEYEKAEATLSLMSQTEAFPPGEIERILTAAPPETRRKARRRRVLQVAMGAVAALVCLGAFLVLSPRNQGYATGIAETRKLTLPDGTKAILDAGTRLEYRADERRRVVELHGGAVVLEVAPHEGLSFEVRAADWVIKDIGTTFEVQLRSGAEGGGSVSVSVEAGEVALSSMKYRGTAPVKLVGGEEAEWDRNAPSPASTRASGGAFATWREGRLTYRQRPLDEVVADLQRHHAGRLRIVGPNLGELTVTGTLNTGNVPETLVALEQILPVQIITDSSGDVQIKQRGTSD
jgi:transmembrane sensor